MSSTIGEVCEIHNASFDISVLRHTLDEYKIQYPKLDYYCTRAISHALCGAVTFTRAGIPPTSSKEAAASLIG
jgi:DNA polymerase III epsilon subunit-like protein